MNSYFDGRDPWVAGWELYLNGFCCQCLNCEKAFEVEEGIPYDCFSEIDFCSDKCQDEYIHTKMDFIKPPE